MVKYIVLFIGMLMSSFAFSQHTLTVNIMELKNSTGQVAVELFDSDNKSIKEKSASISNNQCAVIFDSLPDGLYAIRYFHDENNNKELDTNLFGIPKEGIGFSNDAYGKFGPEDFEEWLFTIKGKIQISLTTMYY